jgi:hypothetical protein
MQFQSEDLKGYLVPQIAIDQAKDCDRLLLRLYQSFKESKKYISPKGTAPPAHIYVRYDNAFARINLKLIANDLMDMILNPRDIYYLPFTVCKLAKLKSATMEQKLIRYLDFSKICCEDVCLPQDDTDYYPSLKTIRREVLLTVMDALKNFPTSDNFSRIRKIYETSDDKDAKMVAEKTLCVIRKKMVKNTGESSGNTSDGSV